MPRLRLYKQFCCALLSFIALSSPQAAPVNQPLIPQRQHALEQQLLSSAPDVRLAPSATGSHRLRFPAEQLCFPPDANHATGKRAWRFRYDLCAAVPFSKPDGFRTDLVSLGFMLG